MKAGCFDKQVITLHESNDISNLLFSLKT